MQTSELMTATIFIVPPLEKAVRLSDLPSGTFSILPSRKGVKKAIDKGLVKLNGTTAQTGDWVSGGETLELLFEPNNQLVFELKLEVIYEDDYLAVVNKPAGIEVSGNKRRTVTNALPFNVKTSREADALNRPQPAHRLDFPTTGALLVAKTRSALTKLNQAFQERHIRKDYLAVAIGDMPEQGEITFPVDGKPASSQFKRLQSMDSDRFNILNLVLLEPQTGRRHQLRKHLAAMGNPILGDRDYGLQGKVLKGKGLYLHAFKLRFNHPVTGVPVEIRSSVPEKMTKLFPHQRSFLEHHDQ